MKANIQGIDYEVRFQHHRVPGHDVRQAPTYNELTEGLAVLKAEQMHPGTIAALLGGAGIQSSFDLIDLLLEDIVAARVNKSHVTYCYILSSERAQSFEQRLVSSGMAQCDKRDNFDRAIGRQYAFARAIDAFPNQAKREWDRWFHDAPMRKPGLIAQCAKKCQIPPAGWRCTRGPHAGGPCAAVPDDGFTRTTTSAPGAAIREERIEFPASLNKAIADALAYGRRLRQELAANEYQA